MKKHFRFRKVLWLLVLLGSAWAALAQSTVSETLTEADRLSQAGEYVKAEELLQKALTDHPENESLWFNIGLAQHLQKKYKVALASWEKALGLGFEKGICHYNIACANAQLGNADEAFSHLEKAFASGFKDFKGMQGDPELAVLHGDKRWSELVKDLN